MPSLSSSHRGVEMEGCVVDECEVPGRGDIQEDSRNNEFLRKFIEMYKSLPELWNSSHPAYINKTRRNIALDKLLNIYIKMKPRATRADVRRKINSLRSNYRKELKKIVLSKRSASGEDEVYRPTSWVFHALKFLHGSKRPVKASAQLNEIPHDDEQDFTEQSPNTQPPVAPRFSVMSPPPPASKRRVVGPLARQNELLSLACKYLEKSESQVDGPLIAKVWGEKLTALDSRQRLYAEKAINDVLFEASLGNLNRYSVKINKDPPKQSSVDSLLSTSGHVSSQYFPSPAEDMLEHFSEDDQLRDAASKLIKTESDKSSV